MSTANGTPIVISSPALSAFNDTGSVTPGQTSSGAKFDMSIQTIVTDTFRISLGPIVDSSVVPESNIVELPM